MAIHGTRIYRSVPGRALIEVTDLDGVVTDALSYEEAQGEAGFLDCKHTVSQARGAWSTSASRRLLSSGCVGREVQVRDAVWYASSGWASSAASRP